MAVIESKSGDNYMIYNDKTFKCADIISCEDYFMGNYRKFYRVDYNGNTINSMDTLTECRKIAKKLVK